MTDKDPDLVSMLNEAGHTEQATSLAAKLAAEKKDPPQDERSGNDQMNDAIRGGRGAQA